jgi:Ca-activated chloride channel family protein
MRPFARWAKRCLLAAYWVGALFAQPPTVFRSNVNLVRVLATVRTKAGKILGTLGKEDFEVYDNGVKQQIAVFEHQTEQKLSVVLLVDTSGSTAKDLKFESDSASHFLHVLLGEGNPLDRAALYSFNWQIREEVGFTHDLRLLDARVKLLHGEAGTAMYDAVYLAARNLEPREGRKVIVVVTDGGDTTSTKDVHQALEAAQLADAVIYAIVAMPITNDAGRNIGGEHALQFMADGTGGRTFLPTVGAEMDNAFSAIVAELRTQYLLGFYPHDVPPAKNRFHSLEVRVLHPDLRVSARNGYYGDVQGSGGGAGEDRVSVSPDRPLKKRP